MSPRNFVPNDMFRQMALAHRPTHSFSGETKADFDAWKADVLPKVIACLGEFPARVPPDPERVAEWEQDGLIRQRWLIDTQPHFSAALLVNMPKGVKRDEKRPALLCCHGHGQFGKEPVMGNDTSDALRHDIKRMNYDYGRRMAQAGYVTFAIDWMGFGERDVPNKMQQGDCNLYYLRATMFGTTPLAINIASGRAAVDFVSGLPGVDPSRLGVMGLSYGGVMTQWMALCDDRFKAAEIICYTDSWLHCGFLRGGICGAQMAPGLYKLVDIPDLHGLLAPLPLLLDIGIQDTTFHIDSALPAYREVEKIYQAAGAADRLELDLFPGEHAWGGNRSVAFFGKYL
ncbi:MAG: prolyl oligopeptidase family serine peptidase [Kiritimatiellae bacterium]|nr:prolyl oligopeptidase family serine peptidase [Kiritimatiellia bacterium]